LLGLLVSLAVHAKIPQELYRYLSERDPSFSYRIVSKDANGLEVQMTSQTWRGIPWKHRILLREPAKLSERGAAILYITGDGPFKSDYTDINLMSNATGMPVAMLFSIPNQPIFGMREDDLIAHTFGEYLRTQDPSWPLLFPMTKAAIRAMDAIQAATARSGNPIRRFIVTGASKRGWTTWMVGAARDRRIAAIAPMVYDNLNVQAQMPHQIASWGQYSDMIKDYTRRGLQAQLATPAGQKLAAMIDPYSYMSAIREPTLIVRGANDPYWTADAISLYWKDLKQPHWLLTVPNAGHDLGGGVLAALTIGAFARSVAGEFRMPHPEGTVEADHDVIRLRAPIARRSDVVLGEVAAWVASSDTLDFRKSVYHRTAILVNEHSSENFVSANIPRPEGNLAVFLEFRYKAKGHPFTLSLPTVIVRAP
jgi:PhoPQ-activated pathogenicity-related protein